MKTIWGFPEEEVPAGEPGSITLLDFFPRSQQAKALTAVRVQRSPWFIIIWEKLTDTVPGPEVTQPYCCYVRTVIFYEKPYRVNEEKKEFFEWYRVDSTLRPDDVVEFEGERFEVGTGQIVWYEGAWYCREWARRIYKKEETPLEDLAIT